MKDTNRLTRRNFIARTGTALAGAMVATPFGTTSALPFTGGNKNRMGLGRAPDLLTPVNCS